ncbi:MAG: hypothetical protein ACXVWW_05465 [Nocardioides sp.]
MNKTLLNSLTAAEQRFFAETSRDALGALDEDGALDLHARARKARDKALTTYRRSASEAVAAKGSRGAAYPVNQREREKVEEYEGARAQVSRRVATLAARSAAEMRAERLEAVRAADAEPPLEPVDGAAPAPANARTAHAIATKNATRRHATAAGTGRRKQGRRDHA